MVVLLHRLWLWLLLKHIHAIGNVYWHVHRLAVLFVATLSPGHPALNRDDVPSTRWELGYSTQQDHGAHGKFKLAAGIWRLAAAKACQSNSRSRATLILGRCHFPVAFKVVHRPGLRP